MNLGLGSKSAGSSGAKIQTGQQRSAKPNLSQLSAPHRDRAVQPKSEELSPNGGGGKPSNGPANPTGSTLGGPLAVITVQPSTHMQAAAKVLRDFAVVDRESRKGRTRFA